MINPFGLTPCESDGETYMGVTYSPTPLSRRNPSIEKEVDPLRTITLWCASFGSLINVFAAMQALHRRHLWHQSCPLIRKKPLVATGMRAIMLLEHMSPSRPNCRVQCGRIRAQDWGWSSLVIWKDLDRPCLSSNPLQRWQRGWGVCFQLSSLSHSLSFLLPGSVMDYFQRFT